MHYQVYKKKFFEWMIIYDIKITWEQNVEKGVAYCIGQVMMAVDMSDKKWSEKWESEDEL